MGRLNNNEDFRKLVGELFKNIGQIIESEDISLDKLSNVVSSLEDLNNNQEKTKLEENKEIKNNLNEDFDDLEEEYEIDDELTKDIFDDFELTSEPTLEVSEDELVESIEENTEIEETIEVKNDEVIEFAEENSKVVEEINEEELVFEDVFEVQHEEVIEPIQEYSKVEEIIEDKTDELIFEDVIEVQQEELVEPIEENIDVEEINEEEPVFEDIFKVKNEEVTEPIEENTNVEEIIDDKTDELVEEEPVFKDMFEVQDDTEETLNVSNENIGNDEELILNDTEAISKEKEFNIIESGKEILTDTRKTKNDEKLDVIDFNQTIKDENSVLIEDNYKSNNDEKDYIVENNYIVEPKKEFVIEDNYKAPVEREIPVEDNFKDIPKNEVLIEDNLDDNELKEDEKYGEPILADRDQIVFKHKPRKKKEPTQEELDNIMNAVKGIVDEIQEEKVHKNQEFINELKDVELEHFDENLDFDFLKAEYKVSDLEESREKINILYENVLELEFSKFINFVKTGVDFDNLTLNINKIITFYEDLNRNQSFKLIEDLYENYINKKVLLIDLLEYESYLDMSNQRFGKIKQKIFELSKIKDLQEKLLLDKSNLNTIEDINNLRENVKKYDILQDELGFLNDIFYEETIPMITQNVGEFFKFRLDLESIKILVDKNPNLQMYKYTKNSLNQFEKNIINHMQVNKIGIYKEAEDYWYEMMKSSIVKTWLTFYENN